MELASELLSGPDLGGGYLFQLTRDRSPLPVGFTFHLQEAGSDAGESPAGSPELLGYTHPDGGGCMYGGPRCWHASFPRPETEASRVRLAYNRTRFVLGPMLRHASGVEVAPIDAGLRELLGRIGPELRREATPWQITGAAAGWVRTGTGAPSSIVVELPAPAVERLADLLEEYVVAPVHPGRGGERPPRTECAAFVGTLKTGIRVLWSDSASSPLDRAQPVPWAGFEVPLASL